MRHCGSGKSPVPVKTGDQLGQLTTNPDPTRGRRRGDADFQKQFKLTERGELVELPDAD